MSEPAGQNLVKSTIFPALSSPSIPHSEDLSPGKKERSTFSVVGIGMVEQQSQLQITVLEAFVLQGQ